MNRRHFLSLSLGTLAAPAFALPPGKPEHTALYANVGSVLWHYGVDAALGTLTQRSSITLPAGVQYAWPHVSRRCLYVVSSDWAKRHFLTALRIDPHTGELSQLGDSIPLPDRPIHVTSDIPSSHVLVAFNAPSGVRVFQLRPDMTIGPEIPSPASPTEESSPIKSASPDDAHAILVTRGIPPAATKPEEPGALKMFDYNNGVLSNEQSIAPNRGRGFGPRHLDFHPTRPWVYVSLETQSKLFTYRLEKGRLANSASFITDTVADPLHMKPRQLAGTIHAHPSGRFVYIANRADSTVDFHGQKVFAGGENSIAVFAINPTTGEPTAIQHIETKKVYPRTFAIDPTGQILVAQHTLPVKMREGDTVRDVPAGFTVFRLKGDGTLSFERTVDVDTGQETMFWMGMVRL